MPLGYGIITPPEVDTIGGFPCAKPNCMGCGEPLTIENAWMTDGCPCNSGLGCNSMNETRWRLLMDLQQRQSRELSTIWEKCKIVYYPPSNEYPIEHNPNARKDGRDLIKAELRLR